MDVESILKEIEDQSGKEYLPIIGPEKGQVLVDVVRKYQPKNILEIGTLVGYSAILMGKNLPEGAKITTLEIDEQTAKKASENIKKVGLSDKIKIIVGSAQDLIPSLDESFNLVFIDADKIQYYEYIKAIEPKLSAKAIIVADNVGKFKTEMKDFLEYIRNNPVYRSKTYDFGFDAVEVSEKL